MAKSTLGTRTGTSTPIRRGGPEQPRKSSDALSAATGEKRQVAASLGEAVARQGKAEPSGQRK